MVLVQGTMIPYSCDEVRFLAESWKKKFRISNGTDEILKKGMRDKHYEHYCKDIDEFLSRCKCNEVALKCDKCQESDHEEYFCRCESRNIRLAKQLRHKGKSWEKSCLTKK